MGLKFSLKGPVFEAEGTTFEFKRVSASQVMQWDLENSVLNDRSEEERKQFADRAEKGESNWDFYTSKEKSLLSSASARFCIDHVVKVENLVDEEDNPIDYEEFDQETKIRLFDNLIENNDLIEWLNKYKAGTEKKS